MAGEYKKCTGRVDIIYASRYNPQKGVQKGLPDENLSHSENFLRMLRPDKQFTELEAKVLEATLETTRQIADIIREVVEE